MVINSITWKNVSSNTISGLLIQELPSITKPPMRYAENVVDGRDGSIIEELGYGAYDKTIAIGLYGNYDINAVISYFTGEGNLILSNEPNYYYKAKIVQQIDFNRLVRFRTASVKFRVQPFKYKVNETDVIYSPTSTEESSTDYIKLVGNHNGSASITKIGGKTVVMNQLAVSPTRASEILSGMTYTNNNNGTFTINGTANATDFYTICVNANVPVANHKYLICGCPTTGTGRYWLGFGGNNADDDGNGAIITNTSRPNLSIIFKYVSGASFSNAVFKPQIFDLTQMFGAGNEPSTVAQFKAIFPNDYYAYNVGSLLSAQVSNIVSKKSNTTEISRVTVPSAIQSLEGYGWGAGSVYNEVDFGTKKYIQRVGSRAYQSGDENNSSVVTDKTTTYYALSTPIETDISSHLNGIIVEQNGTITFEQQNNTMFPIANTVAYISGADITNSGNIKSKPTFIMQGIGTVEITLNNVGLFSYNFGDTQSSVTIDAEQEDAYDGAVLKNRNMAGEFPLFNVGVNAIVHSGDLISLTIKPKSRWL